MTSSLRQSTIIPHHTVLGLVLPVTENFSSQKENFRSQTLRLPQDTIWMMNPDRQNSHPDSLVISVPLSFVVTLKVFPPGYFTEYCPNGVIGVYPD